MEKILTVSVAAYNVAGTISKTLDSCCLDSIRDKLEVIVVNDGSTDETAEIIQKYCNLYPDTFILIDKQNGGYGSTLNASMKAATGKYFKPLDGDDWFWKDGIEKLIKFLSISDADIVVSGRSLCRDDGTWSHDAMTWERDSGSYFFSKTMRMKDVPPFRLGMWQTTVKTSILKEFPFCLPEHCFYTDALFVAYALSNSRTIAIQTYDVYCYHVGINEQSVSVKSRIAHFEDSCRVFDIMYDYYKEYRKIYGDNNQFFIVRMAQTFKNHFLKPTLLMPASLQNLSAIKTLDQQIKRESPELYRMCGVHSKRINWYRKCWYQLYWVDKMIKPKAWY